MEIEYNTIDGPTNIDEQTNERNQLTEQCEGMNLTEKEGVILEGGVKIENQTTEEEFERRQPATTGISCAIAFL